MVTLEALVGGGAYAVLAFFSGALFTAGFLLPAGEAKLRNHLVRASCGFLLAFLVIACFALVIQGAKLRGGAFPSWEILLRYVTLTQSGKLWLAREVFGVSLALGLLWLVKQQAPLPGVRLLALLALPLLAGRSLSSHAAAVREETAIAVASDALHLIATALWGGGLMAVAWTLHRGIKYRVVRWVSAAETVRRFSLLALLAVAALVISGFYQSWIQVGSLSILFATDYGRVLIVKLLLFSAMLSLGATNLLFTKPRLLRAIRERGDETAAAERALKTIGGESAIGLLVFFVTGLLTVLPPGVHAVHQTAGAKAAGAAVQSADAPPLAPAEGARVQIVAPKTGQLFDSDQVPLRFTLTKGKRGDHVHAYIDGELMGMFQGKQGTLNGIKPGRHVLELRVVAGDHQTELAAQDRVEFIVEYKEKKK